MELQRPNLHATIIASNELIIFFALLTASHFSIFAITGVSYPKFFILDLTKSYSEEERTNESAIQSAPLVKDSLRSSSSWSVNEDI